jgi:hypothetical protein
MKRRYVVRKTMRHSALVVPGQATPFESPDVPAAERSTPSYPVSVGAHAGVPFLWGLGAFVIAFLLALYASIVAGWWPWHFSFVIGLIAAAVVAAWVGKASFNALWTIETIFNVDLDGDGQVGQPTTELSATIERPDGSLQVLRDKFQLDPGLVIEWGKDALLGKSIGINAWTGSGKPFTRTEYENFLSTLNQMGLAHKAGGNQGWQLTDRGRHYFRSITA